MKKRTLCIFLIFTVIFSLFTPVYAKHRPVVFIKNGDMQSTYGYGVLRRVYYSNSMGEYQIRIFDFDKKENITLDINRRVRVDGSSTLGEDLYNSFVAEYGNSPSGTAVIRYRTRYGDNSVCYSIDHLSEDKIFNNVTFDEKGAKLGDWKISKKIKIIDMTEESNLSTASSETVSLIDDNSYSAKLYNNSYLVINDGDIQELLSQHQYGLLTNVYESLADGEAVRIYNFDKNNYTTFEVASSKLWTKLYEACFDEDGNRIATPVVKYQTLLNDDICVSVEFISPQSTIENAEYSRKNNTMGDLQLNKKTVIVDMTQYDSENIISNSNLLIDGNLYTVELCGEDYLIIKTGELKERTIPSNYKYGMLNVAYSETFEEYVISIYDFVDNEYHSHSASARRRYYVDGSYIKTEDLYNSLFDENGNRIKQAVKYRTILNNDDTIYSLEFISPEGKFEDKVFTVNNNTLGELQLVSDAIIVGDNQPVSEIALFAETTYSEDTLSTGSLVDGGVYTGELYYADDDVYDLTCSLHNDYYNDNTYTVNVILDNKFDELKTGTVYLAIYNKSGRLKGATSQGFELEKYTDTLKELTIENYTYETDDYVKIFTWDSDMLFQCNYITYNIEI